MKSTVAELVDCELHYLRIWYARGIQKLVSTYELPETPLGVGEVNWGSQNSKCQVLAKFQFSGVG